MDDDIEKIYKKFNYLSNVSKLLKLVKSQGIQATSKDIQTFLNKRVTVQQTKIIKQKKSGEGKIISFKAFDLLQIDIYVLLKYAKQKKGTGIYLLLWMCFFANVFAIL